MCAAVASVLPLIACLELQRSEKMGSRRVELGFVEEVAPGAAWRLRSDHFPCKVGGRPAWLGEAGLPGSAELRCGVCEQPCAFLLQLYAPIQDRPDAFHRSLFLFACRQPPCYRSAGPAPGNLRGKQTRGEAARCGWVARPGLLRHGANGVGDAGKRHQVADGETVVCFFKQNLDPFALSPCCALLTFLDTVFPLHICVCQTQDKFLATHNDNDMADGI